MELAQSWLWRRLGRRSTTGTIIPAMTTVEFTCPRCGRSIIAVAEIPFRARADRNTTVMLECDAQHNGCGWRGFLLLDQGRFVTSSPTERLGPRSEKVKPAEHVD